MKRILVTGAGGPSAQSFIAALSELDLDIHLADCDPLATGLYLVDGRHRHVVKRGSATGFAQHLFALCLLEEIDLVVPTVDDELLPIAQHAERFAAAGIAVLNSSAESLESCLDKWALACCAQWANIAAPRTAVFDETFSLDDDWAFPVIIKPRRGSGSRGVIVVERPELLAHIERNSDTLIQAYLPGSEYSVDVYRGPDGQVAVPRERLRVDSGVATVARTVDDEQLCALALQVVEALDLDGVNNVQLRRDANGTPCLLEVNPRFPGTMCLTVAAGVNMPVLATNALLGLVPELSVPTTYREVACVRTLKESVIDVSEMA